MAGKSKRIIILIFLIIVSVYATTTFVIRDYFLTADTPRPISPRGELADYEKSTMAIFNNTAPSVVYLFTESAVRGFFGTQSSRQGAGSGFLWDKAGHVVTNYHVIAGSRKIQVRLDSGLVSDATFVGASADHDLAVVRLRALPPKIVPLPIGESETLKVGQAAFAIGNPYGLDRTLTTGVISALNRRLPASTGREIVGLIQTDAAINPGNSGGPLLDSAGRLIGVNTAIISGSGSNAGIGFAVPVDTVNDIVPKLIRHGKVARPGIGISVLSEEDAASLGIVGIVIEKVFEDSEASRAGLKGIDFYNRRIGDIIVAVEGKKVANLTEFLRIIQKMSIGEIITILIERDGNQREVRVKIMDIS